jgi:uncharacterized protein YgiM (DUF1202 family)
MKKGFLLRIRTSRFTPRVLLTIAIVLTAIRVSTASVSQMNVRTAVVTESFLPVRSAPTMVTGTIAQLFQGETVDLTGNRTSDGRWVEVTLLGVDAGWVPADAIRVRSPITNLAVTDYAAHSGGQGIGGVAYVKVDLLPVLATAGSDRQILSQLVRGEQVELVGYHTAGGDWVQLVLPDNRMGWVDADSIASDFPLSALSEIAADN